MSNILPYNIPQVVSRPGAISKRTSRALEAVEANMILRMAQDRSAEIVAAERMANIDHLASVAMDGHTVLSARRDMLAGANPVLHDELGVYQRLAHVAKSQVLTDYASGRGC
ncbi:MAG: hypothetical protein JWM34_474 [Ilumatobacteraceae bacterium]|nr:hypothetical protein [Ilumatobacteraceae bacterium]